MPLATLTDYYALFMKLQKKVSEKGTNRTYTTRYRNMNKYLTHIDKINIKPSEINVHFVREFEVWMKTDRNCGNDYTMKNIQMLDSILDLALENEVIPHNPIRLYKYKYERKSNKEYLDLKTLRKLEAYEFTSLRHSRVRDVFVFCAYTGLGYAEVRDFRIKKDLYKLEDGKQYIHLPRMKTKEEIYVPLLPAPARLLYIYNGKIPVISNTKYNLYLKQVMKLCNISTILKTHTARKTFGNIMMNEFDVPLETVSKMLGHKSIKTTQDWYVSVSLKKIMRDMEPVTKLLQGV